MLAQSAIFAVYELLYRGNHVFRFNNPEEVRKQRDRATARSNLYLSVSAADLLEGLGGADAIATPSTRSPSRASSSGDADVDWDFAKREAALARVGLDPTLDNLPDEEINKLFERITKSRRCVNTIRSHDLRVVLANVTTCGVTRVGSPSAVFYGGNVSSNAVLVKEATVLRYGVPCE
jgi:hypothetical protein